MFQPSIFSETRTEVMHEVIQSHPFATLVTSATGLLTADHMPLVLTCCERGFGQLQGHLAAANPLFRNAEGAIPALVVFQGPQTYVSPSWYPSKREHQKVVPTWNYVVVHARGLLRFTQDTAWLRAHLDMLSSQHERHRPEPWKLADAPDPFVARQLRAIAGFEIEIEELVGTWKVSQNRPPADRGGVIQGLRHEGTTDGHAVSELVAARAAVRDRS